jgi:acyl-coenzyme A thioesterase PaaI-like protein
MSELRNQDGARRLLSSSAYRREEKKRAAGLKHSHCYVCDSTNPLGLKVPFRLEEGKAVGQFIPQPEHQSFEDVTHGGILSALLDAAMNRVLLFHSINAKTARLKVRFRKEAKIGESLIVTGEINRIKKAYAFTRGEVRNSNNDTIAQGEAIFIIQRKQK